MTQEQAAQMGVDISEAMVLAESEAASKVRMIARERTEFTDSLAECTMGVFLVFFSLYILY
jgi:hypothetical protein